MLDRQVLAGKEACFIQEASTLGRGQTDVQRPSLRLRVKELLKGKFRVGDHVHIDEKDPETCNYS